MNDLIYFSIGYMPGLRSRVSVGNVAEEVVNKDTDAFQAAAEAINLFLNSMDAEDKKKSLNKVPPNSLSKGSRLFAIESDRLAGSINGTLLRDFSSELTNFQ